MSGDLVSGAKILRTALSITKTAFERHQEAVVKALWRAFARDEITEDDEQALVKLVDTNKWAQDAVRCMFLEEETAKVWAYELLIKAHISRPLKNFHEYLRFVRAISDRMLQELRTHPLPSSDPGIIPHDPRDPVQDGIDAWKAKLSPSLVQHLYNYGFVRPSGWANEDEVLPELLEFLSVMQFSSAQCRA